MQPKVFIIILNWKNKKYTAQCIDSAKNMHYKNYEIVIIDNGSADSSVEYLKNKFSDLNIMVNDRNLGYAGGNNIGIKYALEKNADYVLILNNDTTVTENFLNILVNKAETDERIGVVGPRLKFLNGKDQPAGRHFPTFISLISLVLLLTSIKNDWKAYEANFAFKNYNLDFEHEVDDIAGCAMLIKTKVFKKIGLFDDKYLYCFEETDFQKRAKENNWHIWFVPEAVVYHKWWGSAQYLGKKRMFLFYKGLLRYARKHIGLAAMLFFIFLIPISYLANLFARISNLLKRHIK